jgi:hypothetical protein
VQKPENPQNRADIAAEAEKGKAAGPGAGRHRFLRLRAAAARPDMDTGVNLRGRLQGAFSKLQIGHIGGPADIVRTYVSKRDLLYEKK